MINSDYCLAIVNKDTEEYYYGLKTWGKELRKAELYHSMMYVQEVIKRYSALNLKIVEIFIRNVCDYEEEEHDKP